MPKPKMPALPPEFDTAVDLWRDAEHDVLAALARFRAEPNAVTRLAVIMSWTALRVALGALGSWAIEHQQADDASAWARARAKALQSEIRQVSLVEGRPILFD